MNVLPQVRTILGMDHLSRLWRHIMTHFHLVGATGFTFGYFIILAWRIKFQKSISNLLFGAKICRICFLVGELLFGHIYYSGSAHKYLHRRCMELGFIPNFHCPEFHIFAQPAHHLFRAMRRRCLCVSSRRCLRASRQRCLCASSRRCLR